ncbi:MAG: PDZ domain-containing protein [Phycisphaerales bacterium]|nr:MAG: PDZ domain-containing protein [Phycisphaerales bacterium]
MIKRLKPARPFLLVAAFAAIPALSVQSGQDSAAVGTARQWARQVWQAAVNGDREALEKRMDEVPRTGVSEGSAAAFLHSRELHLSHRDRAEADRQAARQEAVDKMHEHLEARELSQALRQAVTMQTLGEDFDAAFDDPDVMRIVAWARQQLPQVERERDWLHAREILYRLRTLYEDTSRTDEYTRFDQELERVNRRVALLARYAPHRLWELRVKQAEREGEEISGEYVPRPGGDWREQLEGIDHTMLKAAMREAARNHIEAEGWRPLLEGGLEAMHLLATTTALRETFPDLGDAQAVNRWNMYVDQELASIRQTDDKALGDATCRRILGDLVQLNEDTVHLPKEAIFREFGDGAMYRLDRFSEIIWPDKVRRFRQATEGNFTGVGILIQHNEKNEILVVNPLEGTPAYFGGVKPNDIIVQVDGNSTVGWSLNDAVDHITGPKGTEVTLGLRREGVEETIQVPIIRDIIKIRSVKGWYKEDLQPDGEPIWDWYIDRVSGIAYIRLTQFTDDTYDDLRQAWREINEQGHPLGLILDLRHNPGGLLTSAVRISNLFMEEGLIVSGENKWGQPAFPDQTALPRRAELAGVPTIVLINEGSASASEIVAGCLQAYRSAVIVGKRSYGKGSVQTVRQFTADSALKLTTQYYRLPPAPGEIKGRLVHKRPGAKVWGVDPDIEVPMTPNQIIEAINLRQASDAIPDDGEGSPLPDSPDRGNIYELLTEGVDPQLQMALLILQARALGELDEDDTRHASRGANAG